MSNHFLQEKGRSASDPLLQPLTIRNVTFRNRIISTSHASSIDEGGMPKERYQLYHEEKAKGGIALTMFGGSGMISKDSSWGGGQIDMSDDRVIPYLQEFSKRIHRHGAALMMQISHLGRRADAMSSNWLPTIAPSPIREHRHRNFPREMDMHDIKRVIADWGDAVVRAREGGLDGVETLTSGHLMGQFLSPLTNKRTDGFGGSLENRARFCLLVHDELRKRAGDNFIIGLRYVIDEGDVNGISFEDGIKVAQLFEREGTIDFINAIYGRADKEIYLAEQNMPGMFRPNAPYLELVGRFKRQLNLPVFHACRIQDVATARHAIKEGMVDMVGMTRAHMADPQIVNKIMSGQEERIRPCVGASYCTYKKPSCIHNPASGREQLLPQIVEKSDCPGRRVVVIGGGPAGLEAARVSAERGHRVTLLEATGSLGGQILLAARAPHRKDLIGIVDWREAELKRLGVDVRFGVYAQYDDVVALEPQVVIAATGGVPDLGWLTGSAQCMTTWDVLAGLTIPGEDILIWDGIGRQHAPSTAVKLAQMGRRVRFFTPDDGMGIEMPYPERALFRKQFAELDIAITIDQSLVSVRRDGPKQVAVFRNELTAELSEVTTDQVVIEYGTQPLADTFEELKAHSINDGYTDNLLLLSGKPQIAQPVEGRYELHRIGDAVSSRNIHSAIYDALRLCSVL